MNFVTELSTDTEEMQNPSWGDVEREINLLDARAHSSVILAPPAPDQIPKTNENYLAIAGGGDAGYLVFITEENRAFWNLREPTRQGDKKKIRLMLGGQEGEVFASDLVSKDSALRAARRYFVDGQRAEDLIWQKE